MFEVISGQLNRFVNGKIPLKNIEKDAGTDSSTSSRHFEAGKLQFDHETHLHMHTEALPSLFLIHTLSIVRQQLTSAKQSYVIQDALTRQVKVNNRAKGHRKALTPLTASTFDR